MLLEFIFLMAHHVSSFKCDIDFVGGVLFLGGCLGHWWDACIGIIGAVYSIPIFFWGGRGRGLVCGMTKYSGGVVVFGD